jgi:hypothetical protein
MGRFVPITVGITSEKRAPKFTGAKVYYDGKQCWQYKVVYDRPGSYTFTVPSGVTCVRSVLVGGGGKPSCLTNGNCCSFAGAGGGYSEKCMTVSAGTQLSFVVGRQEQDSTLSCNSVAVHTASGAVGSTPGTASGGDWNSRGGCSGFTCNYCNGSVSHYCGSCKYICTTTCCGYCIAYVYSDAGNGGSNCCNLLVAGGASAGSPRNLCGGCSSVICGYLHSGVAGGGGGIGSQCVQTVWHYTCCACICVMWEGDGFPMHVNYPGSAEGGWGSSPEKTKMCRSVTYGGCIDAVVRSSSGGGGGPDPESQEGWQFEWGYDAFCAYPYGARCKPVAFEQKNMNTPCRVDWWDITDICGNGAPGHMAEMNYNQCGLMTGWSRSIRPKNAGEGAGTGGIMTYLCRMCWYGDMLSVENNNGGPQLNWTLLCTLGVCGWCDQSWLPGMQNALFPFFVTCAGTLGGSGGVGWQGMSSKAGKGGGGGQAKCQFLCVCHGGNFNLCNGSGPALAFPPCLLDQHVSNAGTGMAIIYYREA